MPKYNVQVDVELVETIEYTVEARDEEHALELAEYQGWTEYVEAASVIAEPDSVVEVTE